MEGLPPSLGLDREQRERERGEKEREREREKERKRKRERERGGEKERERGDLLPIFAKYAIIFTVYNYHSVDKMLSYILC